MLKYYTVSQLSKIIDDEDLNLIVLNFKNLHRLENEKLNNNPEKKYLGSFVDENTSLILRNQRLKRHNLFDIVRYNLGFHKKNYYVLIPKITFIFSDDMSLAINAFEFNRLPGSLIEHLVDNYHYHYYNDAEIEYKVYEDRNIIDLTSGDFYYPTELSSTLAENYKIIESIKSFLITNSSKTFQLLIKYVSFSTINSESINEFYNKYRLEKEEEVQSLKNDMYSILSDCAIEDEIDRAQQKLNDDELNEWGEAGFWNTD